MIANKLYAALLASDSGRSEYFKLHLEEAMFRGGEKDLYLFVNSHMSAYGKLPSAATLKEKGFDIGLSDESAKYYRDQILTRNLHVDLKSALMDASKALNESDPHRALEIVFNASMAAQMGQKAAQIVDYSQEGGKIIHKSIVDQVLLGDEHGIRMPWPTFDKMAGGLGADDMLSFVGRPASGKSYLMLAVALHCWRNGKTPLFVSMEMAPLPIIQRVAAMDTSTAISEIKQAAISSSKAEEMRRRLEDNTGKHPFWIIDGALTSKLSDLVMYCNQFQPDLVLVDGAYLLQSENPRVGRYEKVAENVEGMKQRICSQLATPLAASWQFNRESTKSKQYTVDNIGYSDAIGQISSLALALTEPESVETLRRRRIDIIKGRNGEVGGFDINWIFDTPGPNYMDFSEILPQTLDQLKFL